MTQLTFKENSTHQQQNTHSSQVHMTHSPRESIFWVTKETSRSCLKNGNYRKYVPLPNSIKLEIITKMSGKSTNICNLNNVFINKS